MAELPIYGNEPRVKCKNLRGPWQEIELHIHALDEIDRPAFWKFLSEAVAGFERYTERAAANPEDIMPWKVLGRKWHFSTKGFPPGKRVHWEMNVLEELCEMLNETAPHGQFLWNNQQVVNLFVPGQKEPWASIQTKKPTHVELILTGPKGAFTLGRVLEMGADRELDTMRERDVVRIQFTTKRDLAKGGFGEFLREHLERVATVERATG
jgi:excinuclease ABC subunit A